MSNPTQIEKRSWGTKAWKGKYPLHLLDDTTNAFMEAMWDHCESNRVYAGWAMSGCIPPEVSGLWYGKLFKLNELFYDLEYSSGDPLESTGV